MYPNNYKIKFIVIYCIWKRPLKDLLCWTDEWSYIASDQTGMKSGKIKVCLRNHVIKELKFMI